jgi:Uma2 family endonuclease
MDASRSYVSTMTAVPLMTAEELLRLHLPDKRTELVKGRLVVREPAGYRHGDVTMRLTLRLGPFVQDRNLGRLLAAETGFKLASDPDTVRAPDLAFIGTDRVPSPPPTGFPALAPDLVVEVLSPDDRAGEVLAKIADWLNGGSRLVWVVDPGRRVARVYRADGTQSQLGETDALVGEDVLPSFSCPLADLLGA